MSGATVNEENWAIFEQAMMMLGDVPGETLLERLSKLQGWYLEMQFLVGDLKHRLEVAEAVNRLSVPAQGARNPVIDEIVAERERQIRVEAWTQEHDDGHSAGEMAAAAGVYALHPAQILVTGARRPSESGKYTKAEAFWPWDWKWFKPTSKRRNLIKAAALIVAEIERLDRSVTSTEGGGK